MRDSEGLKELVSGAKFVHVLGAGINPEKPANTAISDLSERVEPGSRTSQRCRCQHRWVSDKAEDRRRGSPRGRRSIPSTRESA